MKDVLNNFDNILSLLDSNSTQINTNQIPNINLEQSNQTIDNDLFNQKFNTNNKAISNILNSQEQTKEAKGIKNNQTEKNKEIDITNISKKILPLFNKTSIGSKIEQTENEINTLKEQTKLLTATKLLYANSNKDIIFTLTDYSNKLRNYAKQLNQLSIVKQKTFLNETTNKFIQTIIDKSKLLTHNEIKENVDNFKKMLVNSELKIDEKQQMLLDFKNKLKQANNIVAFKKQYGETLDLSDANKMSNFLVMLGVPKDSDCALPGRECFEQIRQKISDTFKKPINTTITGGSEIPLNAKNLLQISYLIDSISRKNN